MIVNIKTKYHEGKIEAPEQLLNIIAYYISVGADYLETKGCSEFVSKEAREISGQMVDALRDKGFFDNLKSDIIVTKRGEKIGGEE